MGSRLLANVQVLHLLDFFVQVQFSEIFPEDTGIYTKLNLRPEVLHNIH